MDDVARRKNDAVRSFKHSGDMGDIIYALPTIRVVGGGHLFLSKADFTRNQPNAAYLANIGPLLTCQSYVNSVQLYDGRSVAFDLDLFRFIKNDCTNIAARHLRAFGLPESEIDQQWLDVEPKRVASVVLNLTSRYRNSCFPWTAVRKKYHKKAVFLGTEEEHRNFVAFHGKVDHYKTANLLEVAEVIAGCELFIGNQSCAYAIAEGLKKPVIQEVCLTIHNCMFNRPDAQYVAGKRITLPDV